MESIKYTVLATDLDGTLTNNQKELTERTKTAIRRAQEAGMHVVLASGRPYAGCWYVAEKLELEQTGGYILAFNGGQIVDCKTKEVLYSKNIDKSFLPEIFEAAHKFGVVALTYEGDVIVSEVPDDVYVQKECFINKIGVKQVDSLAEYVTWPVPKCMIVADHEKLLPVKAYLDEKFGDQLSIYFSEPFFLEIMADGVNKAQSMEALVKLLGTDREHVIGCGDGMNDISLIEFAGLGVAMANACDAVKAAANYQAASNEEDGVAQMLEEILAGY